MPDDPTPPLDLAAIEARCEALDGLPFDSTWENTAYTVIRTDIPALAARVQALEGLLRQTHRPVHQWVAEYSRDPADDALLAEIERLLLP